MHNFAKLSFHNVKPKIGVRGFLERDIYSLRTVAGEGPTQKNSSRRAAVAVAPWKGVSGSMHKFIRKIHKRT